MIIDSFQLIDANEYEALKKSLALYANFSPGRLKVLTHPKLTTVFNGRGNVSKLLGYRERASFILSTPPNRRDNPRALCVVDIAKTEEESQLLESERSQFINESGVDHLIFIGKSSQNQQYKHNIAEQSSKNQIRNRFNYSQYSAVMSFHVDRKIGNDVITVHHEISLDRILRTSSIASDDLIDRIASVAGVNSSYFKHTDVDALVCLGVDDPTIPGYLNSIPLFAVEYDGKTHTGKQGNKDAAKTAVFKAAGIPLIRVSSRYFNARRPNQDYRLYQRVNGAISKTLIENIIKSPAYAKRLIGLARMDIAQSNSKNPVVSRLSSLITRLDHQLEFRIEDSLRLEKDNEYLSDYYHDHECAGYEDDLKEVWESENAWKLEQSIGIPVKITSAERDENGDMIINAALGNEHYHRVAPFMKKTISIGPYNVSDATQLIDVSDCLKENMIEMLYWKIKGYLASGDVPVIERVNKLLYSDYLDKRTIDEIVSWHMGPRSPYWNALGYQLYGVYEGELRNIQDQDINQIFANLISSLVKPQYDERANLLLSELEQLHAFFTSTDIRFNISKDIFQSAFLYFSHYDSYKGKKANIKNIREYLSTHRFIELIGNPKKLREVWFSHDN